MSASNVSGAPVNDRKASWATETLPLAVRKQLLERDLKKLGAGSAERSGARAQEAQQEGRAAHPSADGAADTHAG